jgi:dipeptidyl aminopeptidase/acylaminoacyl peptidase
VSGHDVAARISRVLHKKKEIMEFAIGGWSRGGKMTLTGVVGKS